MVNSDIFSSISNERFEPYLIHSNNDKQKALELYQLNIEVSQSFYAPLSVLEVTLRNRIDDNF